MKGLTRRLAVLAVVVPAAGLWAGCSLEDPSAPALTGPSEFGTAVTLTASPDQVPRDGSTQSTVTVTVRDASNRPIAGQRLSVSTNIGAVSASEVVTGSDGRGSFAFTAPPAGTVGNVAQIQVVPIGNSGDAAQPRVLTIGLTGGSNSTAPTAAFTVTPTAPEVNQSARFDASTSTDEGAACLDACTYSWSFGDGSSAVGRVVDHTFAISRSYTVTLTVTDRAGATGSTTRVVSVGSVAAPTVTLTVAPNPPLVGQFATFTATATAASGHSIVRYQWTFGDGTTQTTAGASVTKTYGARGTYVATVTATDDTGQSATASMTFTIVSSGVTASFTVSPTNPQPGDSVNFNGSASTASAGATITEWAWDFGDGSTTTDDDPDTSHTFTAARTYVVRLTVTDSAGRTGTTTTNVTVAEPE